MSDEVGNDKSSAQTLLNVSKDDSTVHVSVANSILTWISSLFRGKNDSDSKAEGGN